MALGTKYEGSLFDRDVGTKDITVSISSRLHNDKIRNFRSFHLHNFHAPHTHRYHILARTANLDFPDPFLPIVPRVYQEGPRPLSGMKGGTTSSVPSSMSLIICLNLTQKLRLFYSHAVLRHGVHFIQWDPLNSRIELAILVDERYHCFVHSSWS